MDKDDDYGTCCVFHEKPPANNDYGTDGLGVNTSVRSDARQSPPRAVSFSSPASAASNHNLPPGESFAASKEAAAPSEAVTATNTSTPPPEIPDSAKAALEMAFPRCCICDTEWYGTEDSTGDDDNPDSMNDNSSPEIDVSNNMNGRTRPSVFKLLPLPQCQCVLWLIKPPLPPEVFINDNDLHTENCSSKTKIIQALSHVEIHEFHNLAMCNVCLEKQIKASNKVETHDYRDDRPNGQPNVKFTVEPKCTQCMQKFMVRPLERLLAEGEKKRSFQNATDAKGGTGGKRNKRSAKVDWFEAVEATINLVGWRKRWRRRKTRQIRRERRERGASRENNDSNGRDEMTWWKDNGCNDGYGSSEDCYSDSDEDSWPDEEEPSRKFAPVRIESKPGELRKELMQKDPKFRMEVEDAEYAKKFISDDELERRRTEEKDKELAEQIERQLAEKRAEERAETERRDLELAKKLQEKNNRSQMKLVPMTTRPKRLPEGVSHSVVEAFKRKSTPRKEAVSRSILDENVGTGSEDDVDLGTVDLTSSAQDHGTTKNHAKRPTERHSHKDASNPRSNSFNGSKMLGGLTKGASTPKSKWTSTAPQEPAIRNAKAHGPETSTATTRKSMTVISPTLKSPSEPMKKKQKIDEYPTQKTITEELEVDEEKLQHLLNMGFADRKARRCLRDAEGNLDLAVTLILSDPNQ